MSATSGTLIVSQASIGATSLPAIDAGILDGKLIKLTIAGISGGASVKLYINTSQILSIVSSTGSTFFTELWFTWNSTNQDVTPQAPVAGTPSNLTAFNPATFTFKTDATHTVKSFAAFVI